MIIYLNAKFPINYNVMGKISNQLQSYGQILNDVRFYVQALGFDMNINSPQRMTVIEPGVSIENPDGHKPRNPCDQPDFMNFFLLVVKQPRQSLIEHHSC